jgi:integrase
MTKRRGNGEGSITRHKKSGLYMARYWVELPEGRRVRKTIYGKTRELVAEELTQALANRNRGIVVDDENMTVEQFMTRWLEDTARGNLAPRTFHNYHLQIRRHIVPAIGRVKLSKLTPAHVQSLYASKLRDGLKPSSVRTIHAVLRRALGQATKWNMIPRNPAADVDPPRVRQDEIKPLSPSQARMFLDAARGDRFEALYVLSLTTGLRMGEALGLRWTDIEFGDETLRVNRQLQRLRRVGDKAGTLVFSEPKNASRRTLDLPQRALEALRTHRKRQLEEQLRTGAAGRENNLVFASTIGTPLDAQNIINRHFKPLLRNAELPAIRWHDLRHTCATLLLSRGTHPKLVQHLLGHASIAITLDRYSHWIPSMGRHTATAMEDALDAEGVNEVSQTRDVRETS